MCVGVCVFFIVCLQSYLRLWWIGISDISLQKRCFGSQINTSEKVIISGLSEVYLKRRLEQTCWSRIVFWNISQQISALVFYGILSDVLRRMSWLLLSLIWKIKEVQSEKKRRKKNMLSSSEVSGTRNIYFGERESMDILIRQVARKLYAMQCVSMRLDVKVFCYLYTMLLL